MPTSRYFFSTVSNKDVLVAAGGRAQQEMGKLKDKQWLVTKRLPVQITKPTECIVDDTCYILGDGASADASQTTMYASFSSLIESAVPASQFPIAPVKSKWNILTVKHPLFYSSLVELDGNMVAMGGSSNEVLHRGTGYISFFDYVVNTWVECTGAQLPVPLYRPGLVKLNDSRVMVIGGQPLSAIKDWFPKSYLNQVEIMRIWNKTLPVSF